MGRNKNGREQADRARCLPVIDRLLTGHQPTGRRVLAQPGCGRLAPGRRGLPGRRGMTLVELLVVIFILTLLVATALPLMKPAIEESRIREASRQINAFLDGAKGRAAALGRPVGVWIERIPESNAAVQLYLAETPPLYGGDSQGATAMINYETSTGKFVIREIPGTNPPNTLLPGFVNSYSLIEVLAPNAGDEFRIKFAYKGQYYRCRRTTAPSGTTHRFELDPADAARVPPLTGVALPYQVLLNPRRSSSPPLQLPGGTAIDLQYSGIGGFTDDTIVPDICPTTALDVPGPTGLEFWDNRNPTNPAGNRLSPPAGPVIIVFRPSGDVERVVVAGTSFSPNGTIHLLVSKIEQIETLAEDTPETPNPIAWSPVDNDVCPHSESLVDTNSIWISVGHRSGLISSSQNGWNFDPDEDLSTPPNFRDCFRSARDLAQRTQTVGGR